MRAHLDPGNAGLAAISGCGSVIWWIGSRPITLRIPKVIDSCVETKSLAWRWAGDTEFLYPHVSQTASIFIAPL